MTEIHVSKIADWLDCPRRMTFEAEMSGASQPTIPVAQYVGTAVHELLETGSYSSPPDQRPIQYDQTTRSEPEMHRTIAALAAAGNRLLNEAGATDRVWEKTLEVRLRADGGDVRVLGRCDLLCRIDGCRTLLDVKTGMRPIRAAWLQVGIYEWAVRAMERDDDADDIEQVGIIDLPRHFPSARPPSIIRRPVADLAHPVGIALKSLMNILETDDGVWRANPRSMACHSCEDATCAYNDKFQATG